MKERAMHAVPRNLTSRCPTIVRGEGIYLYDNEGNRYMDGSSGSSLVCNIGHGVEEVARVMTPQARDVAYNPTHCSVSQAFLDLAEKVANIAPGRLGKIFGVSSGSEATETAMKFARQCQVAKGLSSKYEIISRWQSYHGNTIGGLSVSGHTYRRRKHAPVLNRFAHIPPAYCYRCYFDLTYPGCSLKCARVLENAIRQEGPENVSAFIAEPVVGAALGAVPAPGGYFEIIREICDKYDVLFISDEVMAGVARTGRNFSIDHWSVEPDMIATGKGLGAGYIPLGAVIMSSEITGLMEEKKVPFVGGHTHSGHLLSCRVGLAVLDYIEAHGVVENARDQGTYLMDGLRSLLDLKMVGDVRGKGLMAGVEFVRDKKTKEPFSTELNVAGQVMDAAMERGLIIFPGHGSVDGVMGDHILIGPPLTIERKQVEELISILRASIEAVEKQIGI